MPYACFILRSMFSQLQRDEILKAASEVVHAQEAYDAAVLRFNSLLDGQPTERLAAVTAEPKPPRQRTVFGKVPDPNSINQRVLATITQAGGPVTLETLASDFGVNVKQIRNAIAHWQKKGVLVHAGGEGQYDLKTRMNGSGPQAADAEVATP